MATDYAATATRAAASIARKGASATITRTTNGAYDVETATQAVTTIAYTVTAIELTSERSHITGQLIEAGHMAYLLPAENLSITPKPGDAFTWSGSTGTVAKVNTLAPGAYALLHELLVAA